jgi:DNA repair exonuclease SbcCD nuclease subunit
MKLVVSSDWHGDHVSMGHPRYAEIKRAVCATVDAAIEEEVDAYLFLGDLCDPEGPGVFRSVELAIAAALRLEAEDIPSFWIAGNHDVLEDGSGETTLTPLRAVQQDSDLVTVIERPGFYKVCGLDMLALPFTATSYPYDPRAAAKKPADIVISHLNVPGIIPGEETTEMARGRDINFPFEETKRAKLRLQGHYHRQMDFDPGDGGVPIRIPGSLARLTFGEGEHLPSFLIVEV